MTVYAGKASNASNGAIFDQELSRALNFNYWNWTRNMPGQVSIRFTLAK